MDEPTLGELGRLIQALRSDVRDDLGQINARLDRVVSTDVYAVEKAAQERRLAALEQAREADAHRITATRRWVIGTVITVVAALLPYLGVIVRGAGA